MKQVSYLIGIDLGTTNCTMAYCALATPEKIEQFQIKQMVEPLVERQLPYLPSTYYFPLSGEVQTEKRGIVGEFAKLRGKDLPNRAISSAKSWLGHTGIDRRSAFLPLTADDGQSKLSPLDVTSEILMHLKEAWDDQMQDHPFNEQQIFITVPASFDPNARQLVLEAKEMAGYPEVVLLEEPQAAFYAWLHAHAETWRDELKVGDTILVVDIGGGTTDFTLIEVMSEQGDLALKRVAVGNHLLLGGDNIDLALMHFVKQKLEEKGHQLDEWQMQALTYACQKGKETLLSKPNQPQVEIVIQGRGSRLIGNSLSVPLTKEEASRFILDGFIPLISMQERASLEKRSGIQQIGLPFVRDPRISAQLAKFLSMTADSSSQSMDQFILPTAVLFNGGSLKADEIRDRLIQLLNGWADQLKRPHIKELPEPDFDFAVSRGAVYFGLSRQGKAIRIKDGTSRSYFIGVEDSVPAVPGIATPLTAICVVPFGMEEGSSLELESQEFSLILGELATFRFFSRSTAELSNGQKVHMGTTLRNWNQELTELHPIETILDQAENDGKTVRVKLRSEVNTLGVLELFCVAVDGRKWKLEFDLRQEGCTTVCQM